MNNNLSKTTLWNKSRHQSSKLGSVGERPSFLPELIFSVGLSPMTVAVEGPPAGLAPCLLGCGLRSLTVHDPRGESTVPGVRVGVVAVVPG